MTRLRPFISSVLIVLLLVDLPVVGWQGTSWSGKVWYVYEMKKYEFDLKFDIPVGYPASSPELALPELDGKTAKMYRGGKICLTVSALSLLPTLPVLASPSLLPCCLPVSQCVQYRSYV